MDPVPSSVISTWHECNDISVFIFTYYFTYFADIFYRYFIAHWARLGHCMTACHLFERKIVCMYVMLHNTVNEQKTKSELVISCSHN